MDSGAEPSGKQTASAPGAGPPAAEPGSSPPAAEPGASPPASQLRTEHLWLGLFEQTLPTQDAISWTSQPPECGAVVAFFGNARDHAQGRPDVTQLEYEAYVEQVVPRLEKVAQKARQSWPEVVRLALLHRTGTLEIGDTAVIVVASSPHRQQAFEAAKFCIDTLKQTVPIWKREHWSGGQSWGLEAQHIEDL